MPGADRRATKCETREIREATVTSELPDLGEDFAMTGYWWLPESADQKVAGTLSSVEGRLSLKLLGTLPGIKSNDEHKKITLIHGAAEARYITLSECFQIGFALKVPGTMEQSFLPNMVYFGDHLPSEGDCLFKSWDVVLTHLGPWMGVDPIHQSMQFANNKLLRVSHDYAGLEDISFPVKSDMSTVKFGYLMKVDSEPFASKSFKYAARFVIQPDEPKPADWFWRRAHRINQLMSLLVGRPVISRRVYAYRKYETEEIEQSEVRFRHDPPRKSKALDPQEVLVPLPKIEKSLEKLLDTWSLDRKILQEPAALLLSAVGERHVTLQVKLLLLCQSLESFHRNSFGGGYLSPIEYESIKNKLIASIPEHVSSGLKQSLEKRITYGYEFSLRKRVREVQKYLGHSLLEKLSIDVNSFPDHVAEARNYYTHWDGTSTDVVLKGAALANLVSRLGAIVRLAILKHLDIDIEMVVARMLENKSIYLQEWKSLD